MPQLQPLRDKAKQPNPQPVSLSRTLVAPTKGWYVGSPMAAAPDQTAFVLDNAFPELDYVRMRGGSLPFATGMPNAPVTALMPYRTGSLATEKMFASCNGSIYDVTGPGAVGAALVTGLNALAGMQFVQFSASGVQTLLCANGVDPVQLYNGTTWGTTPAITGLTGSPLNFLWVYQSNIWGLQPNSLNAWYLPGSTIGGPITVFPMAPLFGRGGSLIAGGTWSIPAVAGLLAAIAFLTDQGEVAVFTGATPGTTWQLQGVYRISPPVGPNCLLQAGGDLAIVTQDGIVPISKILQTDQVALENQAITVSIQPAWRDAVIARQGLPGWNIISWPLRTMALVTLPQVDSKDRTVFVANERTGAWCRYTGWDVRSMAIGDFNLGSLYFGTSDGRVMQGETGGKDDGGSYTATIFSSYTDLSQTDYGFKSLSQSAVRKQIRLVRPRIQSNVQLAPKVTVNVDYDLTMPTPPGPAPPPSGVALWGVALWGVDKWPPVIYQSQEWISAPGIGATIAPIVQVTVNSAQQPDIRLTSMDVLFEQGSLFG